MPVMYYALFQLAREMAEYQGVSSALVLASDLLNMAGYASTDSEWNIEATSSEA